MAPKSAKQQEAANRYLRENVDRIVSYVPKGRKADIRAHASESGESLNGFVNRAIIETMIRDKRNK